jgi:hypothetical protein
VSSSSAPLRRTFHLRISGLPPDANITIYDGRDNAKYSFSGDSSYDHTLASGLYTLRGELGGIIKETSIRLDRDLNLVHSKTSPLVPQQYSAAPLEGTALSHEYYSDPSSTWSKDVTRSPIPGSAPPDANIFVFVRARQVGDDPPDTNLAADLHLCNADGTIVSSFAPSETKSDPQAGWLALSAQAPSGFYTLEYLGSPARVVALYLFPGWQTQVFILHHHRLLIEGMRVFLGRPTVGFNVSNDSLALATDLALDFLQNGVTRVPKALMDQLLMGKFENPMLGLVGAYALFRQPSAGRDSLLLDQIIGNLGWLIGSNAPDLNAIRVLKAQLFNEPSPSFQFQVPPMFRAGLEGVIRASIDHPEILPQGGTIEIISTRLLSDSPWSSWEADVSAASAAASNKRIEFIGETAHEDFELAEEDEGQARTIVPSESFGVPATVFEAPEGSSPTQPEFPAPRPEPTPSLDWVQTAILDAISAQARRRARASRYKFSRLTAAGPATKESTASPAQPVLDLRQLALRLRLPERTIQSALASLNSDPSAADNYFQSQGLSGVRFKPTSLGASTLKLADLSQLFADDSSDS